MSKMKITENQDALPESAPTGHPVQQTRQGMGCQASSSFGFTLLELIVVTAIIGILATLAIPAYTTLIDRAKNARAKSEIRLLETEINAYRLDAGVLPATLATINRAGLLDPWGNPYIYSDNPRIIERERFGIPLNDDFDLFSMGSNGRTPADGTIASDDGLDDVLRGNNGVFLGSGAEF